MGEKPIVSVTYENKKQLNLHKICVTSLLCGPWAQAQCESLTINTNLVPRVLSYPSLRSERERGRWVGERTWARGCINACGFRLRNP